MAGRNHLPLTAYILAGGRSSRFAATAPVPGDKARAPVGQATMIVQIARILAQSSSRVLVVAERPDKYADLGLTTIADRHPGAGPLAGLQAAGLDCATDWLLLCACDWIQLDPRWTGYLWEARQADDEAVVIREPLAFGGRWQPLFALYRREVAEAAARRLDAGQQSMQGFVETIRTRAVLPPEGWGRAKNVNVYQDLPAQPKGTSFPDDYE